MKKIGILIFIFLLAVMVSPSFAAYSDCAFKDCASTTEFTGVLPVANGGTNASSASITSFNNITGLSAAGTTGTTSTNLVFSTSPTFVTPALGVATATSVSTTNGIAIGPNLTYTAGNTTSAVISVTPNSMTSGQAINASSSSNSMTGDIARLTYSGTSSGRGMYINMSNASASGTAIKVTQAGTGSALVIEDEASDSTPFTINAGGLVGIGTSTPSKSLDVVGEIRTDSQITSTRTTDIGWSIQTAANTACNATCTSACVHGWDTAVTEVAVSCSDATADKCLCAGAS